MARGRTRSRRPCLASSSRRRAAGAWSRCGPQTRRCHRQPLRLRHPERPQTRDVTYSACPHRSRAVCLCTCKGGVGTGWSPQARRSQTHKYARQTPSFGRRRPAHLELERRLSHLASRQAAFWLLPSAHAIARPDAAVHCGAGPPLPEACSAALGRPAPRSFTLTTAAGQHKAMQLCLQEHVCTEHAPQPHHARTPAPLLEDPWGPALCAARLASARTAPPEAQRRTRPGCLHEAAVTACA